MKNVILVVVVLAVLGGAFLFLNSNKSTKTITPSNTSTSATSQGVESKIFTMEEIATHNSKEDCWLLISGSVYDVTSFVPQHPGEEKILEGCGKDATELFATKAGSGIPHSDKAVRMREEFKIGVLANEAVTTQAPSSTTQ